MGRRRSNISTGTWLQIEKVNNPWIAVLFSETAMYIYIKKKKLLWNRYIGDNAEMVVIKKAGHAVNLEKSKEFLKHLKSFLIDCV